MKFPKTVAAFAAMEKSQWKIGDALLDEVDDTDRVFEVLQDVCDELEDQGYVTTAYSLKTYRQTAAAFPASRRRERISFEAHREAGSPEMLDAILKVSKTKKPSKREVRSTRDVVSAHIARQNREESGAPGAPRKSAPRGNREAIPISRQETSALRVMAEAVRWATELEDCDRAIIKITALVAENLTKLDDTDVDHLIEIANDIAKHAHKLNDVAQKLKARHERKGQFSVVGG